MELNLQMHCNISAGSVIKCQSIEGGGEALNRALSSYLGGGLYCTADRLGHDKKRDK